MKCKTTECHNSLPSSTTVGFCTKCRTRYRKAHSEIGFAEANLKRNRRDRERRVKTPESMRWWLDEVRATGDTRPIFGITGNQEDV